MEVEKSTERLLGRQLWCSSCTNKIPPIIRPSTHLAPFRQTPYELIPDTPTINKRMVGVCNECLKELNSFRQYYAQPILIVQKDPVYKDP